MTALSSEASIHLDALREVLTAADPDLDAAQRHVMALAGQVRAARSGHPSTCAGSQRHGLAAELSALGGTVEAAFRRASDPGSRELLAEALIRVIRLTYVAQCREPAQPVH